MIQLAILIDPTTLGILALVLIVLLGAFIFFVRARSGRESSETPTETTVEDYVNTHGEPEDVIVLDVTRNNELAAVILVYDHEIIVDGNPVQRDKITNVTFYNAANPYVNSEYLLVITTSLPECPTIETPAGSDAKLASDAATRLAGHLDLQ